MQYKYNIKYPLTHRKKAEAKFLYHLCHLMQECGKPYSDSYTDLYRKVNLYNYGKVIVFLIDLGVCYSQRPISNESFQLNVFSREFT